MLHIFRHPNGHFKAELSWSKTIKTVMKKPKYIKYQVSDEAKAGIKELAKVWQVRPATAVEMAVFAPLERLDKPDSLQQQLDKIEAILLTISPEGA